MKYPKFDEGGIEWPPYSPNFNPYDYLLLGHIKDHCNKLGPKKELIAAIKRVVGGITSNIIESTHQIIEVLILIVHTLKIFTTNNANCVR